jgi:hypothetical protein
MRSFLLGKLAMLFLSTYTLLAKDSFALIVLELFLRVRGSLFFVLNICLLRFVWRSGEQ